MKRAICYWWTLWQYTLWSCNAALRISIFIGHRLSSFNFRFNVKWHTCSSKVDGHFIHFLTYHVAAFYNTEFSATYWKGSTRRITQKWSKLVHCNNISNTEYYTSSGVQTTKLASLYGIFVQSSTNVTTHPVQCTNENLNFFLHSYSSKFLVFTIWILMLVSHQMLLVTWSVVLDSPSVLYFSQCSGKMNVK